MSELLHHDDDSIDPDGPNDMDVYRKTISLLEIPQNFNNEYEKYKIHEYDVIFSYCDIGKPLTVPH